MALKARAARATSEGPVSGSRSPFRSGPSASAARARSCSGRVARRTASQQQNASRASCTTSTAGSQPDSGTLDIGCRSIVSGEPSDSFRCTCRCSASRGNRVGRHRVGAADAVGDRAFDAGRQLRVDRPARQPRPQLEAVAAARELGQPGLALVRRQVVEQRDGGHHPRALDVAHHQRGGGLVALGQRQPERQHLRGRQAHAQDQGQAREQRARPVRERLVAHVGSSITVTAAENT